MVGLNPSNLPLERVRVDSGGRVLTTNFAQPVADNQNSLKAGLRGPALLEDFILREKITHFDHERIPERIVHARGSAAHGLFECYDSLAKYTRADFLSEKGKRTPVFVRFSTVAGERGSTDTPRDVRGFATKFYTDEGNFDIVGNNIPVFFIQDAMKFPDLVHALKPEPHHAMPQAASAHDTFWDFVSLMPESTHMLMWVMSDRALPRSFRTMQGFGVHTFRLVNSKGESSFVKFHWTPKAGTHSLDWDESVKISGADPDYTRRDLGSRSSQASSPNMNWASRSSPRSRRTSLASTCSTPPRSSRRNSSRSRRWVEWSSTGIPTTFSPRPSRLHLASRTWCRVSISPTTRCWRDGSIPTSTLSCCGLAAPIFTRFRSTRRSHRPTTTRGTASIGRPFIEVGSPTSPIPSEVGCPFQAGMQGFTSFPEGIADDKVRGKPEKFADHYSQATLFWNSQVPFEKAHIIRAFRFELTKVQVPAIRERTVSMLRNVSDDLAQAVADGLGIALPEPMPRVMEPPRAEITTSPALSLTHRPGDGSLRGRKVAILTASGVDARSVTRTQAALSDAGAVVRLLAARLGSVDTLDGEPVEPDATFETMPSVLFDAVVVPDGDGAADELSGLGQVREFIKDQFRHGKAILMLGAGERVVADAGVPINEGEDWALVRDLAAFMGAVGKHRNWDRPADPPRV